MRLTLLLVVHFVYLFSFNVKITKTAKQISKIEPVEISTRKKSLKYKNKIYKEVIDFIKLHEGFRSNIYDDLGYPCIGYGQRLEFFPDYVISNGITKKEAEQILMQSFNNHIALVSKVFPGLNTFQKYSVAHMSYGIGIGNILKYGYLYKDGGKWELNKDKLFNSRKVDRTLQNYKDNREFEFNLFYK